MSSDPSRFIDVGARFVDSSMTVSPSAVSRDDMHTCLRASKVFGPRPIVMGLVAAYLVGNFTAQAETAASNLGNFHNGNFGITQQGSFTFGRAQSFTTGSEPMLLQSATLAMSSIGVSGSGGFQVGLYGNSNDNLPNGRLMGLTGSDAPINSANYTFTAPIEFTLAPSTTYWIVAELPLNGPNDTAFYWTFTVNLGEDALPGWSLGASADSVSFMGGEPSWGPQNIPLRMSIAVQSVPEPSGASVIGISLIAMVGMVRRRARN